MTKRGIVSMYRLRPTYVLNLLLLLLLFLVLLWLNRSEKKEEQEEQAHRLCNVVHDPCTRLHSSLSRFCFISLNSSLFFLILAHDVILTHSDLWEIYIGLNRQIKAGGAENNRILQVDSFLSTRLFFSCLLRLSIFSSLNHCYAS